MENDQKRTLVAFLLIIVILLIWSFLAKPPARKAVVEQRTEITDTTKVQKNVSENVQVSGDTIIIEREYFRAVFSTIGAGVKSFYIKKYNVDIVPESGILFLTKIADSIFDFNYELYDDSLVFFREVKNKKLVKVYRFNEKQGFTLSINYPDAVNQTLSLKSGIRITEKKNQTDDLRHFNAYVQSNKFNNITKNIKDRFVYKDNWEWFALRNKYFVLIVNNLNTHGYSEFYKLTKCSNKDEISLGYLGCAMGGNTGRYGMEIFADSVLNISALFLPIIHSELAKYNKGYEQIASGGIWGPIARIIILVLNIFYSLFKNYGVAIIVFAILFKIIFFPLSRQMLISQQKMQMVQPELKKLQDKYKNDPQALNREMMHLYKTYKVNPFSGCLPLLIQFPIFIALYQVLSTSFEFRGAPFILWITDLSIKDPYYVLPISMGVLMFVQSLMTTVDPRQRLMVIMMPVVMIFVFLNFPSGLQLYWFTYNILSIIEQFVIKKKVIR
ncbi:MAG: membrane protein insertase YidC [bacterium]